MKNKILLFLGVTVFLSIVIIIFENRKIFDREHELNLFTPISEEFATSSQIQESSTENISYYNENYDYSFVYPETLTIIDLDQSASDKPLIKEKLKKLGLFSEKYGGEPTFTVIVFEDKNNDLIGFANKYKQDIKSGDLLEKIKISSGELAYKLEPKIKAGGSGYIFIENKNKEKIVITYTYGNSIHEEILETLRFE